MISEQGAWRLKQMRPYVMSQNQNAFLKKTYERKSELPIKITLLYRDLY